MLTKLMRGVSYYRNSGTIPRLPPIREYPVQSAVTDFIMPPAGTKPNSQHSPAKELYEGTRIAWAWRFIPATG